MGDGASFHADQPASDFKVAGRDLDSTSPNASRAGEITTLTTDAEGRRVLLAALDLFQRVAMGQWRSIPEASPEVLGMMATPFDAVGDALMRVRCEWTTHEALRHPSASLGIRDAGRHAIVAYDIWHALGGGMESRQSDRVSGVLAVAE